MEGKLLNNRYEIKKIIGTGGMAIVYDGYDHVLSRNVAIKILKDSFSENDEFVDKLQMEAQASASISDDNIVSIYDASTTEINGKTIEYIVMEKVDGKTLKDIIREDAPLSNERIINYALQIAKALQTAHRHGLVHRDIKPANILITEEDKVKVVDFGIARVSTEATLTYTSSILGTVHYISPEQAKGQVIDERSDLYSLGVVLYEMATGEVPFDGESPVSIAVKHIQEIATPIIEKNTEISDDLSNLIDKLLEKKPDDRYKTASNLLIDLNRIKDGQVVEFSKSDTVKLPQAEVATASKQVASYTKRKQTEEDKPSKKKNRAGIIALSIALIFALIYGAYSLTGMLIRQSEDNNYVLMPSLVDISEDTALSRLEDLDLVGKIQERVFDNDIISGNVISQSISSQTRVKKGSIVELIVSKGKEMVTVPDITGFDVKNIEQILKDRGLSIGERTTGDSDAPKNQIIRQIPRAGELVERGTRIDVILSNGPGETKATVPSVEGLNQNLAISTIRNSGMIPGEIYREYSDTVPEGDVIRQSIAAGKEVDQGTIIYITISMGREPVEIPETEVETEETPEETVQETETEHETPHETEEDDD